MSSNPEDPKTSQTIAASSPDSTNLPLTGTTTREEDAQNIAAETVPSTSTKEDVTPTFAVGSPQAQEIHQTADVRASLPSRSMKETDKKTDNVRTKLQALAREAQTELKEIADTIELAKQASERMETQNLALQDYIGGMTRSMAKGKK